MALIVLAAALAVLLCAYIALCAYARRDVFWKGTLVMGVDVSGLTTSQAREKLNTELPKTWAGRTLTLSEPMSGEKFSLGAEGLVEPEDLGRDLDQARCGGYGKNANFMTLGVRYLNQVLSQVNVNVLPTLDYTAQGREQVDALLNEMAKKLEVTGKETVCRYSDDAVIFVKGRTGLALDREGVRQDIAAALAGAAAGEVAIALEATPPAQPDFNAIYDAVFDTASAAYLDRESGEVIPSVTGKELDITAAKAAVEAAAEGAICPVKLVLTVPNPTTEELNAVLFRDILGQAVTRVTGTADRHVNVAVAAEFLNNHVIFPDEEFSFNKVCSPYTVENGYGKATAYVNGLSKDTVAGGICQASSTLYWAMLRANLETVERSAHRYEPTYIRGGLDATVYGDYGDEGGLDFRFKNNTDQPIRLEAYVDAKNDLHVLIHGTDTTGIHGEPYSTNRVITQAYQTIYEANANVPQGTTRKDPERTGYNGVSIETHQKLTDAEGNVIEDKLLYKTKYYVRNEVIFFNPADIWLWNIDPVTGLKLDSPASGTAGEVSDPEGNGTGELPPSAPGPAGGNEPAPTGSQRPEIHQPSEETPPAVESYEPTLPPAAPSYDPNEPLLPPGL